MNLKGLLLLGATMIGFGSYAQLRNIDMEIIINDPVNGATYPTADPIPVKISIVNHGPDNLVTGDSLYLIMSSGNLFVSLPQDINPGDSLEIASTSGTFNTDVTVRATFCARIADDPTTQITANGEPVSVSYIDPKPGNNEKCVDITIEAEEEDGSSVDGLIVEGNQLQLFPNPAKDRVYISGEQLSKGKNALVIIRDMSGREISVQEQWVSSNNIEVNTSSLRSGLYIIEVTQEGKQLRGQLNILQ